MKKNAYQMFWNTVCSRKCHKKKYLGQKFDTSQKHVWCEPGHLMKSYVKLCFWGKGSFSDFNGWSKCPWIKTFKMSFLLALCCDMKTPHKREKKWE